MRANRLALGLGASVLLLAGAAVAQSSGGHAGHAGHGAHQAAAPAAPAAPSPIARAELKTADGAAAGTVTAFRGPQGLLLTVEGQGWPEGWHGVHLHAVGKCEGPGFTSAGAHVNHAEARPHGLLNGAGGPDLGDLQNVYAHADGSARAEVYLASTEVDPLAGEGLSFLVHANRDDHHSQPIGGAGGRIACGVFTAAN